jgi:hypothetical protein
MMVPPRKLFGALLAALVTASAHAQGGATCTAAINEYFLAPASGSFGFAARNGAVDEDVLIGEFKVNAIV